LRVAIAGIAGEEGLGPVRTIGDAAADLAIGGVAGAAVGAGGAALLTWSRGRCTSTALGWNVGNASRLRV
jgi:hypothetical protein